MFSKFKSNATTAPQNPFDNNPITQHFEIGKLVGSCGPEYVWKIYECFKKNDGRVSINIFLLYQFNLLCPFITCAPRLFSVTKTQINYSR